MENTDVMEVVELPKLPCAVCDSPTSLPPVNCILSQPVSLPYCQRCITEGLEAWWLIVATVGLCTIDSGDKAAEWRACMAPWAIQIIDRSLKFHGRTEDDLIAAVEATDRSREER